MIMRRAVAIVALLTTGGLTVAFADPPPTPVAPASQGATAPSSTAESGSGQSSAAAATPATAAASAAQSSAAAPAKPAPSAANGDSDDKELLKQGYKPRVVRGEKVYCKREVPTGSNLPVTRCMSAESAKEMAAEGKEMAERIQRNGFGCLSGGKCGN
jgi:hypothetical protein